MEKVKVKAYGKVNFTLDIVGIENGFHKLKSLVSTINLFDEIVVKKRTDKNVSLTVDGFNFCEVEKNNAYITAKKFIETFNTFGVDIFLKKNIPVGGGLGGSSSDIVGVAVAMKKLFSVDNDLTDFVSTLGSDTAFLLKNGYAVISGKGEKVDRLNINKKFYLLLLNAKNFVSAKESYKKFDELNIKSTEATDKCVKHLKENKIDEFLDTIKNDLYPASSNICPQIEKNLCILSKYSKSIMTGSGSCVFGIFLSRLKRNKVYRLLKKQNLNLIKAETN